MVGSEVRGDTASMLEQQQQYWHIHSHVVGRWTEVVVGGQGGGVTQPVSMMEHQ
jgi:hypothetical protein